MMRRYTIYMAVALAGSIAAAQDGAGKAGDSNSTASEHRAASPAANVAPTSPSAAMARAFTQEAFDKRWAMEEKMYRDAGIADEKIAKMKELNQKMWDARTNGDSEEFKTLSQQRKEILSAEEIEKLRSSRRGMIQNQLGTNGSTTGTATTSPE